MLFMNRLPERHPLTSILRNVNFETHLHVQESGFPAMNEWLTKARPRYLSLMA